MAQDKSILGILLNDCQPINALWGYPWSIFFNNAAIKARLGVSPGGLSAFLGG